VLRRILGPKKEEVTGQCKNCIMRSFIICTLYQIQLGKPIEEDEMGGTCSIYRGDEKFM
jgi:hypothetical protein